MRDHAGVIAPPPLLALGSIGAGLLAHWGLPLGLPGWAAWPGWGLLAAGIALALWAERRFKAAGTPAMPWKPTQAISTDGPYRFTRNPMYLGLLAAQAGTGMALGNGWVVLATAATFIALRQGVVLREEAYLSAKFGAEYDAYRARVRRWL